MNLERFFKKSAQSRTGNKQNLSSITLYCAQLFNKKSIPTRPIHTLSKTYEQWRILELNFRGREYN